MDSRIVDQAYLPSAVPTPRQLEYQDWELGVFIHFGVRTYYEGHRDFDGLPMPAEAFRPSCVDCDDWVVTAKRAGARYMVLICKHHDGFANWPTKYSNHSVAHTPWKDGKGDLVREYVDACRRHGMKVGLYYSPAEPGHAKFSDHKAYDDYFLGQLRELLTGYGDIDLLWFDSCGSETRTYDWAKIIPEIRRMQPNMLIFSMGDPDFRWINEAGVVGLPIWNTVSRAKHPAVGKPAEGSVWLPPECNCMIRLWSWFYESYDPDTVKPLEELLGIYYRSVGRGANLVINIGPDRSGRLPVEDSKALLALGAELRRRFSRPIAVMQDGKATDTGWEYEGKEPFYLDHVVLQEDLTAGEAVRRFAIHVKTVKNGQTITVYEGRNIGHKAICSFPLIPCSRVMVEITQSDRPARLRSVALCNASGLVHQH